MSVPFPVLFIGHGSPMNAIEDNSWRRGWRAAALALPRPKAILCVSAHWETLGVAVSASPTPPTIHDFGGFPQALFDARYPAPGDPALARRVADLLAPEPVTLDPARGLDHGAWSVPQQHYDLARRLAPLRDEGVLIVGSGDIVHNLRAADFRRPEAPPWADRFNETAKALIQRGEHGPLIDYEGLGPDAAMSINSAEHYLPLLYVLALQQPGETASFFNDDVFAAISMTSVQIGSGERKAA
jgi:4,5-DOPA dioxygenase extradiol